MKTLVGWVTEIRGCQQDVPVAEVSVQVLSMFFVLYKRMWKNEDVEAEHPSREMCTFPNWTRFVIHFYSVEIKHYFNKVSPSFTQQIDSTPTQIAAKTVIFQNLLFLLFSVTPTFVLSKTSRVQNNLHESQSYINLFYISVLHFFFKITFMLIGLISD